MKVLGVSAHYHDATAALVVDGRLVFSAAEERFTRVKHDASMPAEAIAAALSHADLHVHDLDAVVFYEEPHVKFTRVLASTLGGFPRTRAAFSSAMKRWLGERLWTQNHLSKHLDLHPDRVHFVPHHHSHAAQAFLNSPHDEAAILTIDAVGEWDSTTLAIGRRADAKPIRVIERIPYPHSLGLFYAAFTGFLGFRPNSDECSTMALATFGQPRFAEQLAQILRLEDGGTYTLDPSFFEFVAVDRPPFTQKLVDLLGAPRPQGTPLPFRCDGKHTLTAEDQHWADLAASVQDIFERAVLGLVQRLKERTGLPHLCLAGGSALNCVANRRIQQAAIFETLFIPPDPGDGGGAAGAALLVGHDPNLSAPTVSPYAGAAYSTSQTVQMLDHMSLNDWSEHRMPGIGPCRHQQLGHQTHTDPDALIGQVVDELRQGRIVGWFQGRFENGPRALGNRSILVDPSRADLASRLSEKVKLRAPFRPYAFSITEEDASKAFGWNKAPATARWMQTTAEVKDEYRDKVQGALHCDGTTRPQVCSASDNPRYHALLEAYGQASGLGALLNTSFNARGYPMVATPPEALLMFSRTDMDTLVLGNTVIRKE